MMRGVPVVARRLPLHHAHMNHPGHQYMQAQALQQHYDGANDDEDVESPYAFEQVDDHDEQEEEGSMAHINAELVDLRLQQLE